MHVFIQQVVILSSLVDPSSVTDNSEERKQITENVCTVISFQKHSRPGALNMLVRNV